MSFKTILEKKHKIGRTIYKNQSKLIKTHIMAELKTR